MAETTAVPAAGEMKRSLTLTGVTVNGMALIAPGAFLWTTFQEQAAQTNHGVPTGPDMWTGLVFAFILAMLTAWSYSQLARIYPDAGTGSSYYFAESAFLDKERPEHQRYARVAKLTFGWISHLYYWIYPGIMIAFIATLVGYIYSSVSGGHQLGWGALSLICIGASLLVGYIAYRGISGSTMVALVINVIQIVTLVSMSIMFIVFRVAHPVAGYALKNAGGVVIPHSFIDLLYQSTIAILLLVGFESITALGSEALRPERDIQRGVMISLLIQGGFCYLFEYFSSNLVVGSATMAGIKGSSPYIQAGNAPAPIGTMVTNVADKLFGGGGTAVSLIVAVTVLLALLGTTLACINTGVRLTYSMAKDKEMPSLLSALHGRFATPHAGIWVLTALSAVIGIYGVHTVDNLTQITLASNIGTFLVYGMTCVICLVAFASRHDRHSVKHIALPGLGALMNIVELLGVVYLAIEGGGTGAQDAIKAIIVVAVWAVAGLIWVAANPNKGHARGITEARMQGGAGVSQLSKT